jgi:hypothetical protein
VTTQRNEGKLFKNDQSGVQDWITVAVYAGDALVIACSAPLYDTSILGDKLCVSGTAPISSVVIDELHRLQEFFSVDPKETVSSGLSRVVGQSRAVMLARFDDTISIGRPNIRFAPAQWAVVAAAAQKATESQSYQSPVHYRIVGAWDERDVIDHDGMQRLWRHFFNKAEDPNLMTSSELNTEAAYVLAEMRARQRLSIQAGFNPFVEYADSVTYTPYGEAAQTMLIESERISVTLGQGGAPVVAVEIGLHSGGV